MKGLKRMGLAAIAGFAAASLFTKKLYDKKRQKELDEFFLPDQDEPVVIHIESKEDLKEDIDSLTSPVLFIFEMESKEKAILFQDLLSEKGLSSTIDASTFEVEVMYNDELTEENKTILYEDLSKLIQKTEAKYKGYHLK
ncbi:MAG: hypothetical protein SO178_07540 [Floccifex porci]|uniref:hypothetical protein n=1 Tax=Floccifex porci TaxID=2606629 RepID=UPI0023F46A8B|nr:hypothetical protein [Floccifex porci]MCI7802558.1 hypothetical protein [Erysipelotrichaceae bacterium]MDD7466737.1 hypothetical protein [Floccifex porci]MDO4480759.1 hypothetical protein [Erysipelotrichaceae bacterium]MDY4797499.1 hypothetical protein [Floccifex porci]